MGQIIRLIGSGKGFESAVSLAVKVLSDGGVVAVPTDTLYGLVSTIENIDKLYAIKRRSRARPCGLFVAKVDDIKNFCHTSLDTYILKRLLPGPVTLLFQRSAALPDDFNPGCSMVGIRLPKNHFVRSLGIALGSDTPLVQTSANLSDNISPVSIEDFHELWPSIDLIIDGGSITHTNQEASRKGSTIVNLSITGNYSIIRDGCARMETEAILRDCGLVALSDGDLTAQEPFQPVVRK